jgi:tetratricopeptide (TPR) repeat protein
MASSGMLKHLPFFEVLGTLDEADPSWRSVSAGLVVLRLVDAWTEEGPSVTAADSWALSSVLSAIEDVPSTTTVRPILRSIVEAMASARTADMHAVTPRLMAYGQALEYESKWKLAADVYRTIIAHAHPIDDADIAVPAHLQLASCLNSIGETEDAGAAYGDAGRVAEASGDLIGVLRARIGEAQLAARRGNVPEAEAILDETIARAGQHGLADVSSRALHDRAYVAGLRGQYDRAVQFGYRALELATSQRQRDRVLADIATAMLYLGVLDAARDAYLVLAATAQEQYVRWTSALNLMEIAARQGFEPVFERYRHDFETTELPPYLAARYLIVVGEGYHSLGRVESSASYLERAIDLAARHRLNQLVFEAESSLAAARSSKRRLTSGAPQEVPVEVAGVARAIHQMKASAGIPG